MNTLILSPEPPTPPTSGFRLRIHHLARELSRAAEVELAALTDGGSTEHSDLPYVLARIPHHRWRLTALARSVATPYMAAKFSSRRLEKLAAERRWDTVQAESPFTVRAAVAAEVPVVLDAHNVESDVVETMAAGDPSRLRRLRWRWEQRKTARFERTVVALVDAVAAASDDDAAVFEKLGAKRTVVVPNGVDTDRIAFEPPQRNATALYVGHFGYAPNELAASELVTEIFPRVLTAVPTASLQLVGGMPSRELQQLAGRSGAVQVTGAVEEVVPYLREARVLVVPLRAGGGTRLKILEAMAAGLPVVTTSFGAAGLDVADGRDLLIAESPADIADQTTRVIHDDALAETLAGNARRLVERKYAWSIVAEPLLGLHEDLGRT